MNTENPAALRLDKHGYLQHLEDWSPEVAQTLAANEALALTQAHWEIIHLLRDFHARTGLVPAMRAFVKLLGRELGADKGSSHYLMLLFGGSPIKLAAKVAGLPRPTNCI